MKKLPASAHLCTVKREGQEFVVNCVGFKMAFDYLDEVATLLGIDWPRFREMADVPDILILVREKGGEWRSSKQPVEG